MAGNRKHYRAVEREMSDLGTYVSEDNKKKLYVVAGVTGLFIFLQGLLIGKFTK